MRIGQMNTLPYVTATGPKWNKKICAVWFYSYESGVFIRGVIPPTSCCSSGHYLRTQQPVNHCPEG